MPTTRRCHARSSTPAPCIACIAALCLLALCWLLAAPARAQVLLRDDFSAPYSAGQQLDPARWTAYDNGIAYGRTRFGNVPTIENDGANSFARLRVSDYSGDANFPFRGTEIFSPAFSLGAGKEMEARVRITNMPPGLVAAFWAYSSKGGNYEDTTFRSDEIDIEFLTQQPHNSLLLTNWDDWDWKNPNYDDDNHHKEATVGVAGLDWVGWNTYKIRWLPDRTDWYVNDVLVQSLAPAHPDGPLTARFNAWAPDQYFTRAYNPSLPHATNANQAQTYYFDVDWVEVRPVALSLSLSRASWSEAAGSAAAMGTVSRDADLSQPLSVNLFSNAPGSVPSQVTIAAGAASASFSIAAADDFVAQGSRPATFIASAADFASAQANATITDEDVAGLVLSPASGLQTSEAGAGASFTVRLSSQPLANVRLDLSSSRPGEGTASPASLAFTPANWSVPQLVSIAAQDDLVADGAQPYAIALSASASNDAVYKQLSPALASVVNADNDVASIVVPAIPGLLTSEGGRGATFSVRLSSQPTAPVTMRLQSSSPSEGTASPSSLTFTALDWSAPKIVIVTGANDLVADGSRPYAINILPATSADAAYNGLDAPDVSLSNEDDDVAGVIVAPQSGLATGEPGLGATFSVSLSSQPLADVTIALSSSNPGEGTVSPASLSFSASNWMVPRLATVSGADDDVADGDQPYSIVTGAPASADAAYAAISATGVADVQVLNRDNDVAGVSITPLAGLVTSESGQAAEFSIVLRSRPRADVALSFAPSAPGEGAASPASLLFTPGSWSLPQKVTLSGLDDDAADGDQLYAIVPTLSSVDAGYQVLGLPNITVTNLDNDLPALSLSLSLASFSEGAGAAASTATVTRNTPVAVPLTIALSSSDATAATVPATITIAAGSASASFEIAAVDDAAADAAQSSAINVSAPGLAGASATVTVVNDDVELPPAPTPTPTTPTTPTLPTPTPPAPTPPAPTPQPILSLRLAGGVLMENAMSQADRPAARARVERSVASPGALLVQLSSSDASELRVPPTVLIPAGAGGADFELAPVDDLFADGTKPATISASAEGFPSPATATVQVRDDEAPTLSISVAPARIAENGAAIVTIRRNSEVTAATPALRVALSVSTRNRATIPASVVIPARAASVSVQARGIDNARADGPARATITASAPGWLPGPGALSIQDNEAASSLSLAGRVFTSGAPGSLPAGSPVGGATLSLFLGATIVDATRASSDGRYKFSALPPGSYRIVASKQGASFAPASRAVTLAASAGAGGLGGQDFVATLRGQISGRMLRLNQDGTLSSIPNALVTARSGRLSLSVRTDRSGGFRFDFVPLGLFELTPALPGTAFAPPSRQVRLDASTCIASGLLFTAASGARALNAAP